MATIAKTAVSNATNNEPKAPVYWLNLITTQSGKTFFRSRNVRLMGIECQLRVHEVKKENGEKSLMLAIDPAWQGAGTQDALEYLAKKLAGQGA